MSLAAAFAHMSTVVESLTPTVATRRPFVGKTADHDGALDAPNAGHRSFEWRIVTGSRSLSTMSPARQEARIALQVRYQLDEDVADVEAVIDGDMIAIVAALRDPAGFDLANSTITALQHDGYTGVEQVFTDDGAAPVAVIVGPEFIIHHQEC